jgi:hypothetical protein
MSSPYLVVPVLLRRAAPRVFLVLAWITPFAITPAAGHAQVPGNSREVVVLEGRSARVVVDLAGGSIGEFRLIGSEVNPLGWATPERGDTSIRAFGHFLCLDRWGPPSAAEGARGMPYHGEAPNVRWEVLARPTDRAGMIEAGFAAKLPLAGLSIRRTVRLSREAGVFQVEEVVTNENALGRLYNAVQHPTIAPPFLDETTRVDCNGRRGFAQGGPMPDPEEPSSYWPRAFQRDGEAVNLRFLADDPEPNVVSYTIDEAHGWVTAGTPRAGLLLGYIWRTRDYPWVSHWRDVRAGKPAARGLEFGTTGLHEPFPVLVRKGRIWDRPLFAYLDAGESVTLRYTAFLIPIPEDFAGIDSVQVEPDRLILRGRAGERSREWTVSGAGLMP